MLVIDNPNQLWQMTWKRTAILTAICVLPLLAVAQWPMALGTLLGGALFLGDIYALKAPLDMMLRRTSAGKRAWVFLLGLLRILILAAVLFVLVKFRIASIFGIVIGVTMPIVAIGTLLLTGGLTAWKV